MATAPDTNVLPFTGSPIARKLALVMAEVHRVPKNGRNDFHKYNYIMESDLVDALRSKLADQGVAVLPSIVEHTAETIKDNRNRESILATVTMDVTFIDGESGDTRTVTWIGQGVDSGDKAYYKAYTGAFKYALMKTFMVSSGDDPEVDDQPAPRRQGPRREQRPQQRQERRQEQPAPRSKKDVDPQDDFSRMTEQADSEECDRLASEVAQGELSDRERRDVLIEKLNAFIAEAEKGGLKPGLAGLWVSWVCDALGVEQLRDAELAMLDGIWRKMRGAGKEGRIAKMQEKAKAMQERHRNEAVVTPPDDPAIVHEVHTLKQLLEEAMRDGATKDEVKAFHVHLPQLFDAKDLYELTADELQHTNRRLRAKLPDERAGYLHRIAQGGTDDVILPLPGRTPPDRQKEIKRFCAIASEPFAKESSGSKDTAESFRQALKVKWGVESFNDVEVNTIVKAADALKALDLKGRHIHMTQMIKEVEG